MAKRVTLESTIRTWQSSRGRLVQVLPKRGSCHEISLICSTKLNGLQCARGQQYQYRVYEGNYRLKYWGNAAKLSVKQLTGEVRTEVEIKRTEMGDLPTWLPPHGILPITPKNQLQITHQRRKIHSPTYSSLGPFPRDFEAFVDWRDVDALFVDEAIVPEWGNVQQIVGLLYGKRFIRILKYLQYGSKLAWILETHLLEGPSNSPCWTVWKCSVSWPNRHWCF